MNQSAKKEYDYFSYFNKPLVPAYCVRNGLHSEMYSRAKKGFLVNFLNPLDTFRSINISEIVTEKDNLDRVLAKNSANELSAMGLDLPINFQQQHVINLNCSYILNSCLCFVLVETKKGIKTFFATKSSYILSALKPHFAVTELKKKLDNFQLQFTTSYNEVNTGVFETVTFSNDKGGLRLGKAKINCNAKSTVIIPMYVIGNYLDSLDNHLRKNKVVITYKGSDGDKEVVTTLIPALIAKWLRTNNKKDVEKVIDNSQNPYVFGELFLPDLYNKNKFVNFHALSIKSVKKF